MPFPRIRPAGLIGLLLSAGTLVLLAGCRPPADDVVEDAGTAQSAQRVPVRHNVDFSLMDPAVVPGDDFYRHANGAWLDRYELPPDRVAYGTFYELNERAETQVRDLIQGAAAGKSEPGSIEQQIGDLYLSFMNVERLNTLGIEPLAEPLERIAGIDSLPALIRAFGRSSLEASHTPIGFGLEIDRKDPGRFIAGLYASGLGLPERDYYLDDSERFRGIREAYREHIRELLTLTGQQWAAAEAGAIIELETAIARIHWPRAKRRDRELTYNLRSIRELIENNKDFDWQIFFEAAGAVPDLINVNHPDTLTPLIALVRQTPLAVWKAYLAYHLISNHAPFLSTAIDDANFSFYGRVLSGQETQRERWRRAVSWVGSTDALGDAVGRLYVDRHFPPEYRAMMLDLVRHLRAALAERIRGLDWMGDATKARALEKLEGFLPKIGYPDRWRDFSSVTIRPDDLIGNVQRLRAYYNADAIARLGQPTDRNEWFSPAHTVNAFYNPQFNAITFPAGILQPPFFDPEADAALNYGAIGAVIGHEMGHGFDDQGSRSNAKGVLENWWTPEDRKRFEARAKRLAAQYDRYEPIPGVRIDGDFTLGENIGDLGGLNIAYHAYRASLSGSEPPVLDGLTGEQRFFLAFAQLWRAKIREEALAVQLKSDPHAPPEFRTNGVVRNVDAWYEAFGVDESAALYLPPEERVRIW